MDIKQYESIMGNNNNVMINMMYVCVICDYMRIQKWNNTSDNEWNNVNNNQGKDGQ